MKKNVIMGFAFMENVSPDMIPSSVRQLEKFDEDVRNVDPQDSLLRLVYTLDDRTKLPVGDLTYFVNPKANPEIKKFILDNLMMDTSGAAHPSIPKGIPDDLALSFVRNDGESLDQYVSRLNQEVERAKWLNSEVQKRVVSRDKGADQATE